MRTASRWAVAALATTALVAGPAAAPASAAPLERGSFHDDTVEVTTDFCDDMNVRYEADVDVHYVFVAHGPDRLAHYTETVHGSETFTNLATGRTMTHVMNFVSRDLKVTDNGDGTLTIIVLSTGSAKWFGPDGELVFNEPGQIRFELLVDDNGTPTDPFDDGETEFVGLVKGSTGRNDTEGHDFCEDFRTITG
jgi:hypothetical protein